MHSITIPVIKVHQSIWDMYIGVLRATDLYAISAVDRIRLENLDIPKYAGYQRAIDDKRVTSIRDYLSTPECTFPNSIIISIDSDYIDEWSTDSNNENVSIIKLQTERGAAKIIDGQHRGAALDAADDDFQVIVTIFVDLEMTKCAQIFAKINSTQKVVNPSIAYQLFGYADARSPQKTAHEIAETLNNTKGSPFYKKLKMLGRKDDWSTGSLSQSTFSKHLMLLYTRDAVKDENKLLRKDKLDNYEGYPLRKYFIKGDDKKILEIVWKYFFVVAKTWHDQWNDLSGKSILIKTTGYAALIQILRKYLLKPRAEQDEAVFIETIVRDSLKSIKEKYESEKTRFIRDNYPAGNQGVIELRNRILGDLNL